MDSSAAGSRDEVPLFGRERERELLRDHLDRALDGHGSLVLVGGEAGIGKTALVRDLIARAVTDGARLLHGGCYDLASTPPYGPWLDALRTYRPSSDDPPVPDRLDEAQTLRQPGGQADLLDAWWDFLAALSGRQPVLLVLEDMHWADRASLETLRFVGRQLERLPLMVVCTYRSDELVRGDDLTQVLPVLVRESRARRIHLNRLDREAIAHLVAHRYTLSPDARERLVEHVAARSDGNPFFAGEILQSLEDRRLLEPADGVWSLGDIRSTPVPTMLRQALDVRLAHLDAGTQRAAQVAAVIGQEIPLDLWQTVAGLDADGLDRAVVGLTESQLLEEDARAGALYFRHALLREAVYESILPGTRRELHRRCAEALVAGRNPDPYSVAYHFQHAGDDRELEWVIRAGLRARNTAAFLAAVEHFERAAELLAGDAARVRERAWLLFYAVFLSRYYGELRPESELNRAEQLAELAGDRLLLTTIQFHRGLRYSLQGQARKGLGEFRAAVAAFEKLAGVEQVAHVDVLAPRIIRSLLGAEAQTDAPPAEHDAGDPAADPTPLFARSILATWMGFGGHYCEALEVGQAIVAEMQAAVGDAHLRSIPGASGHFALGQAYAMLGRPDAARDEFALARQGYEMVGDSSMADVCVWSDLLYVALPFRAERLDERSQLVEASERIRSRSVDLSPAAWAASPGVVAVHLIEGRWAEARHQATGLLHSYALPMVQSGVAMLGVVAREQGESDLAWRQVSLLQPDGPDTEPGDSYFPAAVSAQRLAADLALDAGDLPVARAWIDAHRRWLEWSAAELWWGDHHLLEMRYQLASGDLAAAGQAAATAETAVVSPRQPLALLTWHRLSGHLGVREGRLADAREHLDTALDLAEQCAAPFERALTLVDLAALSAVTGDQGRRRDLLAQARDLGAALGALRLLRQIDALDGVPAASGSAYLDGLTAREVEILRLLASGKSNQDIATALYLSTRTVERHVANVYRKIGAHNRVEASAYAHSKGLHTTAT